VNSLENLPASYGTRRFITASIIALHLSLSLRRQCLMILIIGLCILLRVYQLNIGTPPYATTFFFCARFIVHFALHVSAPIGGHLQVVYKHIQMYSRYSRYLLYIVIYPHDHSICLDTYQLNGSVEYVVITSSIFLCVYKPHEDGHRSGPKHIVQSAQ
jgi:hypothetical protein